jgi:hypothetical protein
MLNRNDKAHLRKRLKRTRWSLRLNALASATERRTFPREYAPSLHERIRPPETRVQQASTILPDSRQKIRCKVT